MTTIVAPPWEEQPTGGGIADAPTDGKTYGRKDAAWAEVVAMERAAEIVTAAVLPMPDVWAPLSDSLRMITGYGRDVLVGSDVVARMVNFSRSTTATYIGKDGQLKTAAANEPRFEKEGLLIEGQSTNYIVRSEGLNQIGPEADSVVVVENGVTLVKYVGTGAIPKDCTAPANTILTFSFFVKMGATDTVISFQTRDGSFTGRTAHFRVKPTGELVVANGQNLLSSWSVVKVGPTLVRVVGTTTSSDSTIYRTYRGEPVANETFGSFQLEALPFASSYIPTAGAAATRAADKAWLNVAGNLIPLSVIALEFNSIAPSSFYQAPNLTRYIVHTGDGTGITAYLGRFTTQFEDAGAAQGSTISQGRTVVVGGVSGGKAAIRSGAGLASGVAVKGFKQTEIYLCNSGSGPADRQAFGHVRNLRMYHRDLTADQYKAVA